MRAVITQTVKTEVDLDEYADEIAEDLGYRLEDIENPNRDTDLHHIALEIAFGIPLGDWDDEGYDVWIDGR